MDTEDVVTTVSPRVPAPRRRVEEGMASTGTQTAVDPLWVAVESGARLTTTMASARYRF